MAETPSERSERIKRGWETRRARIEAITEKVCSYCNELKPLDAYGPGNGRGKRQARCRMCLSAIQREKTKTPAYRAYYYAYAKEYRIKNVIKVGEYLRDHPCVDCGETDMRVLDFDHVRGTKVKPVSVMVGYRSWATVQAEIDKCEVRCSNCHRKKTAGEQGWYAYLKDFVIEVPEDYQTFLDGPYMEATWKPKTMTGWSK